MNRRAFLARAALVGAGAVVADKLELMEQLAAWAPRRLFPSIALTHGTIAFEQHNRRYAVDGYANLRNLSQAYRRSTTKLYRQYTRRAIEEYSWFDDVPDVSDRATWPKGLIEQLETTSVHQLAPGIETDWIAFQPVAGFPEWRTVDDTPRTVAQQTFIERLLDRMDAAERTHRPTFIERALTRMPV